MKTRFQKGAVSWAMYDWANSSWATTVLAGFFPVFFNKYWASSLSEVAKQAWLGYANSAAAIVVFCIAPIVGVIADRGSAKKRMLMGFAGVGIILTGSLYFVQQGNWPLAAAIYALSYVFWLAANISYDSLIVSVSSDADVDKVSGLGFSMGYLGGGILFIANVLMFLMPQLFGLENPDLVRLGNEVDGQNQMRVESLQTATSNWRANRPEPGATSGDTDADLLEWKYRMALLEETGGDLDEAEKIYNELLTHYQDNPGEDNEDLAKMQGIMARLNDQQGDLESALALHTAAIQSIATGAGPEANAMAEFKENLARHYELQGDYNRAAEIYQESYQIRRNALMRPGDEKEDAEFIIPLAALARVQIKLGRFDAAMQTTEHIHEIRIENLGNESPMLTESNLDKAVVYEAQGRMSQAEAELLAALETRSNSFDQKDPLYIENLNLLAAFYLRQGNQAEARRYAEQARDIAQKEMGADEVSDHPEYAPTLRNLVNLETQAGNTEQARTYRQQLNQIESAWLRAPEAVQDRIGSILGLAQAFAVKLSFVTVAIWWAIFTLPLLLRVREPGGDSRVSIFQAAREGFGQLAITFKEIRKLRVVFMFLLAYWFYIDGVDTIIAMAVNYGATLGIGTGDLITALLMVQFVAFPFAYLFGWGGQKHGPKVWIMIGIFVYILITIYAALFLDKRTIDFGFARIPKFYVLAFLVGTSQGGVQALSRSLFARLIPEDKSAEFFGFYNMIGKFAAIIGPTLMGSVGLLFGTTRAGIFSIILLFLIGGSLLMFVNEKAGSRLADEMESDN
ncbi:MAG: MFS transporter [Leptospiraceae bacterium]|nr:MFS transporter [Leptospiraceae bacterium]